MNAFLQTTLDTVAFGTQMLKQDLIFSEQGPTDQETNCQDKAVKRLIKRVMQLECDVSELMAKYMCVAFRHPDGRSSEVLDELWNVFLILDCMYADVKMLCRDGDGQGVHPAELKQLQVCWVRLNKLTKEAGKRLAENRLLTIHRA
jgi:hypothetical protein